MQECWHHDFSPVKPSVIGWMIVLTNTQVLIPVTYQFTSYGKRDFAVIPKLSILRWEDYSGLFGWALDVIMSILVRGRQKEILLWKRRWWDVGSRDCNRGFKNRGSGAAHQVIPTATRSLKGKEKDSLFGASGRNQRYQYLDFSPVT